MKTKMFLVTVAVLILLMANLVPVVSIQAPVANAQEDPYIHIRTIVQYDQDKNGFIGKTEAVAVLNDYLVNGRADKELAITAVNGYLLQTDTEKLQELVQQLRRANESASGLPIITPMQGGVVYPYYEMGSIPNHNPDADTTVPCLNPSDEDILALAKKYAPVLHFHPLEGEEGCFPSDADAAYAKILDKTFDDDFGTHNWATITRTFDPSAPCYFQFSSYFQTYRPAGPQDACITRIKYWFWYNFNTFPDAPDAVDPPGRREWYGAYYGDFGDHEGDWESVEVILRNHEPFIYLLSCHQSIFTIPVLPQEASLEDGHIEVWVACGSHANYPSPYSTPYWYSAVGITYNDCIEDSGPVWHTETALKNMSDTNFARDQFTGQWGLRSILYPIQGYGNGEPPRSPVGRQFERSVPYYKIYVKTGTEDGAGTDANVYIKLCRARGCSKELELDNNENNFENGQIDVFTPGTVTDALLGTDAYLGDLASVEVSAVPILGHAWFLDSIEIWDLISNKWWFASYNWWFVGDPCPNSPYLLDVAICKQRTLPLTSHDGGWVEVYDDSYFHGKELMIDFEGMNSKSYEDFKDENFNDIASSVRWFLPYGYRYVLFENPNYDTDAVGPLYLDGHGRVEDTYDFQRLKIDDANLGAFNNEASSGRFEYFDYSNNVWLPVPQ